MSEFHLSYRPDAQAFDEIRIRTVPRYKESEISGDGWRISAVAEFYRNGELKHTSSAYRNVETLVNRLTTIMDKACEEDAFFGGEADWCDQEGCSKKATIWYKRKKSYCSYCGNGREHTFSPDHRKFCNDHKVRGDCGLDDADNNYEAINPTNKEKTND